MNNYKKLKRRMAIRYQPNNIKKMRVSLFNKVMKDEIQKELDNEIINILYDLSKKDISQYYNPYQPLAK